MTSSRNPSHRKDGGGLPLTEAATTEAAERVAQIGGAVERDFAANKRVLSFAEYIGLVDQQPHQQLRNAAQYACDMFDHYGVEQVRHPSGPMRRFRLFDAPWDEGRGRLIGQEEVQNEIYRVLRNFVRQGRVDRFILLHGPNGSAKSTIADLLARAMEHYSALDEGALYRFCWVFPTQSVERSGIGFGGIGSGTPTRMQSYAHLDDSVIDARIQCDLSDHPALLIPRHQRTALLQEALAGADGGSDFALSDYIANGDLCHKCKQIYEALLSAYEGDFVRVMRHVRVERFYVSRRYSVGAAKVEPQMAVDATLRQVTGDRSLSALPSALQSMALFDSDGELVRANRGLIDFADMFKRPLEAFKYLLTTVETGQVSLAQSNLYFDLIFIGSGNANHLDIFASSPEWMSFKGRFELIRVPYLLDYRLEQRIYDDQIPQTPLGKPVAPHATEVAALWAVLTRLRAPEVSTYPEELRGLISKLQPLDKARLYAEGVTPSGISAESAKALRAAIHKIWAETESRLSYEGRTGASAREIKSVVLNAAQNPRYSCVTPEAVIEEIEALAQEASVYEFLREEPHPAGYGDHRQFIGLVRQWALDRLDEEVQAAFGLVEASSYAELFTRYVNHVTHALRREKLRNPVTGAYEDPDPRLMKEVEQALGVQGDAEVFRQAVMTRIGAWSVDHPGERPDYAIIFHEHFDSLRSQYFERQHERVRRLLGQTLQLLAGEESLLDADDARRVHEMLGRLESEYGYSELCARQVLIRLVRSRYSS